MRTMHGFYSERMKQISGSCLYRTLEGVTIEVTEVSDEKKCASKWSDTIYRGEVVHHCDGGLVKSNMKEPRLGMTFDDWRVYREERMENMIRNN